jgi:hypothetical protein
MRSLAVNPLVLAGALLAAAACGPGLGPNAAGRTPLADQWLKRAQTSYKSGDFDDAYDAGKHALDAAPRDVEIRTLEARVALTKLDFNEALRVTEGLQSTEAHSIRGRAHWYLGDIEQAADELEAMLQDPSVKDAWARDVARLARQGSGRHPFEMEGSIVAQVDMPRVVAQVPLGAAHVVPCELEGDRILALIATGTSEVIVDVNSRREPAWVNLRFSDLVEVKDVPALTQDLSAISHSLGVPIKALLGANLLRHVHATFDRRGDQFVVRKQDATPPPEATRVPLWYVRGGGMTLRASVTSRDDGDSAMAVDSSRFLQPGLLALEDSIWKKAGIDVRTLTPMPDSPNVRRGFLPSLKLGGIDLVKVQALEGLDFGELQSAMDVDIGGLVGAELLANFRVTFADEGRFMWIEADPTAIERPAPRPSPSSAPQPSPTPSSPSPSPSRSTSSSPSPPPPTTPTSASPALPVPTLSPPKVPAP